MPQKRALITGITGQDGSYLAEHLLGLGYEVHGLARSVALEDPERRLRRIGGIRSELVLHPITLENHPALCQLFRRFEFDECYHLAAQSFVAESLVDGFSTMDVNINGTHYLLAAVREGQPSCRIYFAASSELFGDPVEAPQHEQTPFRPRNPYGISKVAGFHLTRHYREAFQMHCLSGILFNHESPRRGREFVTRKITRTAARIRAGLASELLLGDLDARRDWGHAADYVQAMHLMLQRETPDDYVIATGVSHTVREFCELAFSELGLDYREWVVQDPNLVRAPEPVPLVGDASKAREELGWRPRRTFEELVREMVHADQEQVSLAPAAAD